MKVRKNMKVENLTLTNFNGRKFNIHTYTLDINPQLIEQKKPLMIVIPGGSFDHLSKREGEPVALAYLSHGYNAVVMDYNLVQDPGTIYPDAGLDVLTTVKYYRDNADKYNIDPQKIITIGFSAGGHVASSANYMANNDEFAEKYGYISKEVLPNKTILGYPLINIDQLGFAMPEGAEKELPSDAKLRDTALGVSRETPATFIFQAWDDPIVLISNSIEYIRALYANQVKCEAHLFTKGGHGFSLARPEVVERGRESQDNPHDAKWFSLSLEWLKEEL